MRPLNLLATAAAFLAGPIIVPAVARAADTFTTIDNPADPTFNQLLGINNAGVIAGYFGSTAVGHPNKGYTVAPPYTIFKPDNLPGSVQTQATGINSVGATSGFWSNTNLGTGDANFGFIRWPYQGHTIYLSVNDPKVSSTPLVNQVLGINNVWNVVGFYNDAAGASHGFEYSVTTGKFTPVTITGATSDAATGINNHNLISGFFVNKGGATLGFVKPLTGGNGVHFSVPGSTNTQLLGVNDKGVAVGFYIGSDTFPHGLVYTPATGVWHTVNDPNGAQGTVINGLNDKHQLVGFYMDAAGNTHGMLVTVTP